MFSSVGLAFLLAGSFTKVGAQKVPPQELPPIADLIELAYPTWCIDENETRITDVETCEDGSPNGRWSPLYFTKRYSGADPALGGYPTNIDIQYAFEYASPFMGQACAGSPHFCDRTFDGTSMNCKACPKLTTNDDTGPHGPGHVPPHISLAAVTWAYNEGVGGDPAAWFDFEENACRIKPDILLTLIRHYYPRDENGTVYYPPPFSDLGGAYPLEFVNLAGDSCAQEMQKHSTAGNLECFEQHSGDISLYPEDLRVGHGSPHYCTEEGILADVNPDWCPYIFFGPNRGRYRHPHIAYSAVETYLANLYMPENCGTTWDDSNYPAAPDTTVAFPDMTSDDPLAQAVIHDGRWIWPGPEGTKSKTVAGDFATELYDLPPIADLIELAYPTWCIDENETRITDVETCEDGSPNGKWSPLYFTKRYSGADPALGGYPTNIDIQYAFEYASPFMGQACAGSPHFCDETFDGTSMNCKACPKLTTNDDNGPYGPGHVPPHISLAAVTWAYNEGFGGDPAAWFNFEQNACRIKPDILLALIRHYYPRDENGNAYYPPPFSDLGGAYPLEFVNLAGDSCAQEMQKHSTVGNLECFEQHSGDISLYPEDLRVGHGSPHYCTEEGISADVNPDWCPYIFFGPNRGKYRHPHIAYSAVETYLANMYMPENCGTTWDDSNYPATPDTTVAFPDMTSDDPLAQAVIHDGMWTWPGPEGTKRKPVAGNFATELFVVEGAVGRAPEPCADLTSSSTFIGISGIMSLVTMIVAAVII